MLNTFGKFFEKTIYAMIENHLELNNIIPNEQLGFRKGFSANHKLLRLISNIKIYSKKSC